MPREVIGGRAPQRVVCCVQQLRVAAEDRFDRAAAHPSLRVAGVEYDQTGLLAQLRQRYLELMRGDLVLPGVELAPLADVSRQLLPAEAGV